MIGQVNKHVKEMEIHIAYETTASENSIKDIPSNWIKHTYNDRLLWTDRVYSILQHMRSEYVLFIHEDWLPVGDVSGSTLNTVLDFMDKERVDFMMSYSHPYFTSEERPSPMALAGFSSRIVMDQINKRRKIPTGIPDYDYYYMGWHVFQPAIWRKSVLEEFCAILKKTKSQNEDPHCLTFMSTKNCWAVQNTKTIDATRCINSLIFPHMHALSVGLWNSIKYPTLKGLMESYGIETNSKGECNHWELDYL